MAAPSITELPEKTINGFVSKWNASSLPIQYTINNDKYPTGATVTNYFTQVMVYVNGSLVATLKQIPDSDNNTKIDVRKYVQTALSFEISDTLRDTNASAEFYIEGTEEYIDSSGVAQSNAITGGGSGVVHYATLSSLQFGNNRGGNMYDYILDSSKLDLAKWMTFFERGQLIDSTSFLLSIIVNEPGFDLEVSQYDINSNLLSTSLIAVDDEGVGLYRLSLDGVFFATDTKYVTVQSVITTYGTAISEAFTVDTDFDCAVKPDTPSGLTATAIATRIDLLWSDNSADETGFIIRRGTTSGNLSNYATVSAGVTTYSDTSVTSGQEYFYDVIATGEISSTPSNEASATAKYIFEINTDHVAGSNFTINVTYSGADTPAWVFEDGTIINGASINELGSDVGLDGTSQVVKFTFEDTAGLSLFQAALESLTGALDFSVFVGSSLSDITVNGNDLTSIDLSVPDSVVAGIIFRCDANANLATITLKSGQDFQRIQADNCGALTTVTNLENIDIVGSSRYFGISGGSGSANFTVPSSITGSVTNLSLSNTNYAKTLDISGWTFGTGTTLQIQNCGMTGLSAPTMLSGNIFIARMQQNDWTTLDISGLDFNNGELFLYSNTLMTSVTMPTGNIGTLQIYSCSVLTSIDLTGIDWVNGIFDDEFNCNDCVALTSYTPADVYPTGPALLREYRLSNCDLADLHFNSITSGAFDITNAVMEFSNNNMSAAEVNQALVELDGITTSTGTSKAVTLTGDNAAPDGSSGGYDGDAAVTSLVAKNWTVNTN